MYRKASAREGPIKGQMLENQRYHSEWAGFFRDALATEVINRRIFEMKTMQKGFTLIELMIVVAIIGILAAIAVPAYQDYSLRAKVSEASSLMGATRTAIDVANSDGYLLTNLPPRASLGLVNQASYKGRYVDTVSYDRLSGRITVTMQNLSELGATAAKTVIWTPTSVGGTIAWNVSASSTMPAKFLPK